MSGYDLTPEDTAAMRATPGDWREYLRSEMDRGRARRDAKPAPQVPAPPGRRPGVWPPGTRPPDPPPLVDPAETARAVTEYRHWVRDSQPPGQYRCQCTACQQREGGSR